jgi:hypothetical protein
MMDNEIVIVGENMIVEPKCFKKFCLRNIFMKNIKQFKKYHGMSVNPPSPPPPSPPRAQLLSTTLVKFEESHGTLHKE